MSKWSYFSPASTLKIYNHQKGGGVHSSSLSEVYPMSKTDVTKLQHTVVKFSIISWSPKGVPGIHNIKGEFIHMQQKH